MPFPQKRQRLTGDDMSLKEAASADDLSVDVLPNIFGFLRGAKEIMRQRRVCKKWKEAVKKTIVPASTNFIVKSMEGYNFLIVMMTALPNLQRITLSHLGWEHKWSDGEDPDEERAAATADWPTYDIELISNFSKLRRLEIDSYLIDGLNGRYPFLFNFPLLQTLIIRHCDYLKWDLEMLAGLPLLKELMCGSIYCTTGNIKSLRVLKDTLEKVAIGDCEKVEGNFMDLADFPHLTDLYLHSTAVTGDIRDIGENDFSSLELLALPKGVYGGMGYEFQHISDGTELVRAVYLLKKQRPGLINIDYWYGKLSEDSPDRYEPTEEGYDLYDDYSPPFFIKFVKAGSRVGYRWENDGRNPCEVIWLDPEPDRESSDYGQYIEELQEIESEVEEYRGFHQPPTEEEYQRLCEERGLQ